MEYTDSLRLGGAMHAMLGGDFDQQCFVLPPGPFRTNEAKARRDEALAANKGKLWLSEEEHVVATNMACAIGRHELARQWVSAPGRDELTIRWVGKIPLKVRFDRLLDDGTIIEYKTMKFERGDPLQSFRRKTREYGYDLQAALYAIGASLLTGGADPDALFTEATGSGHNGNIVLGDVGGDFSPPVRYVVVDSAPPHDVMALRATKAYLSAGSLRLSSTISNLVVRQSAETFAPGEHNWLPAGFGGLADLDPL